MEHKETVQKITEDLLARLGITGSVSVDIDETEAYRVHIETEETGLLIGFHGKTLESLQIILGIIVSKELATWVK
jgi:spoIIIJ-associated protein